MRGLRIAVAAAAGFAPAIFPARAIHAREPLETRLDDAGPYLIFATESAKRLHERALGEARKLHPGAAEAAFDPGAGFRKAREALALHRPRHALILVLPGELDVHVAWEWLEVAAAMDPDPFVDVRCGFVTGATPEAAAALLGRIGAAARGESRLPPVFIDNLGPNTRAESGAVIRGKESFMLPAYSRRLDTISISHAPGALENPARAGMIGAGVIHFGGHGIPSRIVEGLDAAALSRLDLAPCVVFNGACYSGVTGRFFDITGADGRVRERTVPPPESFCLRMLETPMVGYLASLHPDHGIPVYQEMERLACRGGTLGDAMKSTYDGIVLANGGRLPALERLEDGEPVPRWTPSEIMLRGTASRVLFGDPALVLCSAWTKPPLEVECAQTETRLRIKARVADPGLVNSFTDTYHADLASDPSLFNARALVTAPLPAGWKTVSAVELVRVEAKRTFLEKIAQRPPPALRHRVVAFAVEEDGEQRSLHVQVDLSSTGYRESPFVREGSLLELEATR